MKSFSITVDGSLSLTILPDSEAHLDGHPVLTYSYSIFKKNGNNMPGLANSEILQQPGKQNNPDYLGTIVFEQPDKLFNYVADGQQRLNSNVVQQAIELITEYRDKPEMWSL